MAKNELITLALISNGSAHVYGLSMIIGGMKLEPLAKVSKTSLYNTLARLQKEGCIIVSTERVGNMPEKKVYTLSEKGRARLRQELKAMFLDLCPFLLDHYRPCVKNKDLIPF